MTPCRASAACREYRGPTAPSREFLIAAIHACPSRVGPEGRQRHFQKSEALRVIMKVRGSSRL